MTTAGLVSLVAMAVCMEAMRWAAYMERLLPIQREAIRAAEARVKRAEVALERSKRPIVARHETRWSMERAGNGRVVIVLEEYLHSTAEGGGRYAETRAQLQEPVGTQLWNAVHEQRDTLVEKTLAEGTRVADLEEGL